MGSLHDPGSPGYVKPRWPTWLWRGGTVSIEVSQPPDQFVARLSGDTNSIMAAMRSKVTLVGRVSADGHMVVGWNTPMFSNSWMSFLDGSVAPVASGTLVQGYFRLNRAVAVVSALWILALSVALAWLVAAGLAFAYPAAGLFGAVLLVFFLATVHVARLIALKQEPRVVDHLRAMGADAPA